MTAWKGGKGGVKEGERSHRRMTALGGGKGGVKETVKR